MKKLFKSLGKNWKFIFVYMLGIGLFVSGITSFEIAFYIFMFLFLGFIFGDLYLTGALVHFFSFLYGLKQRWSLKKQNFKTINIKEDFSEVPRGRHIIDGDFCGAEFREKFLKPKLEELAGGEKLIVDIREVEGYASSFLDEAFGGLVRKGYFTKEELHKKLIIKDDEVCEFYTKIIWEMIDGAQSDTKKKLDKTNNL